MYVRLKTQVTMTATSLLKGVLIHCILVGLSGYDISIYLSRIQVYTYTIHF